MSELQTALAQLNEKVTSKMATHTTKIDQLQDEITDLAQKSGGMVLGGSIQPGKSLGSTFINSDGFKAFRDGGATNSGVVTADLQFKSLTSLQGSGSATGIDVAPTRQTGIVTPAFKPSRLYDLLSATKVNSNSFSFTRVSGFTNAATYQLTEGSQKAEQALTPENIVAQICTVAVHHTSSKQVLADEQGLAASINLILSKAVMESVETQLVNGAGTSGTIGGLLSQATNFVPTLTTKPEKIGEAITTLLSGGYQPDAVLLNPADWFDIRRERATGGEYVQAGWVGGEGQSLYDIPVVLVPSLAAGSVMVMDSSYVSILDREAPSVLMSSEHANNFTENNVTALCECRIGLAVYDQAAVMELSLA